MTFMLLLLQSLSLLNTIPSGGENIEIDFFENIWLSDEEKVVRIGKDGKTHNFTSKLGSPSKIDVSNPFKIIIYYSNLSTIIILDNQLIEITRIDLSKIFLYDVIPVFKGNDLWIYDKAGSQIIKLNSTGEKVVESKIIGSGAKDISFDQLSITPGFFVFTNGNGIYIFDVFANFVKYIEIKGVGNLKAEGSYIYLTTGDTLSRIDIETEQIRKWQIDPEITDFDIYGHRLYAAYKDKINVYKLN